MIHTLPSFLGFLHSGLRVQGSGFRVSFQVWGLGFGVLGLL